MENFLIKIIEFKEREKIVGFLERFLLRSTFLGLALIVFTLWGSRRERCFHSERERERERERESNEKNNLKKTKKGTEKNNKQLSWLLIIVDIAF